MLYPKNDRLDNKITIVLLIVFTLIKASPYYYLSQYAPSSPVTNTKQYTTVSGSNNHGKFLVKVDKSIDDKLNSTLIPRIKFAGIPFDLFFLGSFLILRKSNYIPLSNHLAVKSEVRITQCVLRL